VGVAYVRKTGTERALGAVAARDADARVARTNARLESMAVVLIDVVVTKEEINCNNQRIKESCRRVRLHGYSFSSFALNSAR
jgi:hypothetical protein